MKENHFNPPIVSLRQTLEYLKEDIHVHLRYMDKPISTKTTIKSFLSPSTMVVVIFRFSHYFGYKGWKPLANMLYLMNIVLFGADMSWFSKIGPGLNIPHVVGTGVHACIGKNACLLGGVIIGGNGPGNSEVGWLGGPIIGENVTFGYGSKVMGALKVGDHSFIGAASLVTKDVPAETMVFGIPAKVIRRKKFTPKGSLD